MSVDYPGGVPFRLLRAGDSANVEEPWNGEIRASQCAVRTVESVSGVPHPESRISLGVRGGMCVRQGGDSDKGTSRRRNILGGEDRKGN